MGIFLDYPVNPFSGLKNTPTTILATGSGSNLHTLTVNSITICNRGAQNIRINLKRSRTGATSISNFLINEFEIAAYATVELIKQFGLGIFLEYSTSPSIIDSLICFSNGYTQIFDCEVNYSRLNELPMS
jgi:hypothetical protein